MLGLFLRALNRHRLLWAAFGSGFSHFFRSVIGHLSVVPSILDAVPRPAWNKGGNLVPSIVKNELLFMDSTDCEDKGGRNMRLS